jgi:hypothetical protein
LFPANDGGLPTHDHRVGETTDHERQVCENGEGDDRSRVGAWARVSSQDLDAQAIEADQLRPRHVHGSYPEVTHPCPQSTGRWSPAPDVLCFVEDDA